MDIDESELATLHERIPHDSLIGTIIFGNKLKLDAGDDEWEIEKPRSIANQGSLNDFDAFGFDSFIPQDFFEPEPPGLELFGLFEIEDSKPNSSLIPEFFKGEEHKKTKSKTIPRGGKFKQESMLELAVIQRKLKCVVSARSRV